MTRFLKNQTVLSIGIIIYYLVLIVFTVVNWSNLSNGEGWGVIAMFGLGTLGIPLIIAEIALRLLIKDRNKRIQYGIVALIVFFICMIFLSLS